jgi:hypothetical protein|tara:strand:+ start:369 stop:497 length:129 start_codon:yes stop_codon:yes gene_type:complete
MTFAVSKTLAMFDGILDDVMLMPLTDGGEKHPPKEVGNAAWT